MTAVGGCGVENWRKSQKCRRIKAELKEEEDQDCLPQRSLENNRRMTMTTIDESREGMNQEGTYLFITMHINSSAYVVVDFDLINKFYVSNKLRMHSIFQYSMHFEILAA